MYVCDQPFLSQFLFSPVVLVTDKVKNFSGTSSGPEKCLFFVTRPRHVTSIPNEFGFTRKNAFGLNLRYKNFNFCHLLCVPILKFRTRDLRYINNLRSCRCWNIPTVSTYRVTTPTGHSTAASLRTFDRKGLLQARQKCCCLPQQQSISSLCWCMC